MTRFRIPADAPRPHRSDARLGEEDPDGRLGEIDHIVVLVLENRSFDHLLGYLSLPVEEGGRGRGDVDGLPLDWSNPHPDGTDVRPAHLDDRGADQLPHTMFPVDPTHNHRAAVAQMADGMTGFVREFVGRFPEQPPELIMGYYDQREVPVYDFLAAEYCVCDRWFSSHRGATWVNRLFATAGQAFGEADNDVPYIFRLDVPTVFRTLDAQPEPVSWTVFTHDFSSIRVIDRELAVGREANFARIGRFFEQARSGELPAVSWIDPNYNDYAGNRAELEEFDFGGAEHYPYFPFEANDDHPPTDIRKGQQLVLELYAALVAGPAWNRTMLVITYDEHGGFADHVEPPVTGEAAPYEQYGVRVPALVVSPWVGRGSVSHELFDHASIVRTILQRFCAAPGEDPAPFTGRVDNANHLGVLLTEPEARTDTSCAITTRMTTGALRDHLDTALAAQADRVKRLRPAAPPTDLQQDFARHRDAARAHGLPAPSAHQRTRPRSPAEGRPPRPRR